MPRPFFSWDVWVVLCISNLLLDFGRPIFASFIPTSIFPLSYPSFGDYCHMIYNIIIPLYMNRLMEAANIATSVRAMLIIVFVQGASIHLVGDSINHRLIHLGYQNHVKLEENELMKSLRPKEILSVFKLSYFYDEHFGHVMWYLPLFVCFYLYFSASFHAKPQMGIPSHQRALYWILLISSSFYDWYLVTEGQLIYFFLVLYASFLFLMVKNRNMYLDSNGKFLFQRFTICLISVICW